MNIAWYGVYNPNMGYGSSCIELMKALKVNKINALKVNEDPKAEKCKIGVAYSIAGQGALEMLPTPYRILYTMFECDEWPSTWVSACNCANQVWVPSQFCKDSLKKSGCDSPIEVVPLGFNPDVFYPEEITHDACHCDDVFTFGYSGSATYRKGYYLLIEAFQKEFKADEKVKLKIHSSNILSSEVVKDSRIEYTCKELTTDELRAWYNDIDLFVMPSRGEGFGLCVSPKTYIQVPSGAKRMADVNVHDKVMGKDGNFHNVLSKTERIAETLSLRITGTIPIEVSCEHPFLAIKRVWVSQTRNWVERNNPSPEWVRADELKKGDLVAIPIPKWNKPLPKFIDILDFVSSEIEYDDNFVWHKMGYSPKRGEWSISNIQKQYNASKPLVERAIRKATGRRRGDGKAISDECLTGQLASKLVANGYIHSDVQKIPRFIPINEEFLSLLGWYLAEGSGCGGRGIDLSLNIKEVNEADHIKQCISNLFHLEPIEQLRPLTHVRRVGISSCILSQLFESLCGKGARHKRLHPVLYESATSLMSLLKSYFEGDGYTDNNSYSVLTASDSLAWQIRAILFANGISANIKTCLPRQEAWEIRMHGISKDMFEKKTNRIQSRDSGKRTGSSILKIGNYYFAPIRKILNSGQQIVQDIEVEGTHSFIGNGLVLHNTPIEAMACGKPIAVTNWGGQVDYLADDCLYIGINGTESCKGYHNSNGNWARPSLSSAMYCMKYAYDHPDEMRDMGERACKRVHENWTYSKSADRISQILKEVNPDEKVDIETMDVLVWRGDPRNIRTPAGGFTRGEARELTPEMSAIIDPNDTRFHRERRYRRKSLADVANNEAMPHNRAD